MKYLLFLSIFLSLNLKAQESLCYHPDKAVTREKNIQPFDLDLTVKLYEKEGKVVGKAQYKFLYLRKEIDTIFFDAINFNVSKITINKQDVNFKTDSTGITIYLPKDKKDTSNMSIEYSCYPERGMYFVNWNLANQKLNKQIWTQGQGIDNRHWIPGFDDVANLLTMTTHITFNDLYPVVCNGDLVTTKQNLDKTKTWTYHMKYPHALYLTMIAAGDYKMKSMKSKNGIQLDQYYYPDRANCFDATYQHSEAMMDWFEREIGVNYPWGKIYRNVPTQDFLFGAMENTTSTIFADYMHVDSRGSLERAYLGVNAHELAHQWFGDLITERSPPHHWLHESFATHYSKKFMQWLNGNDEFDAIRKGELEASFGAGQSNSLPVAHSASGSPRHYPKGSFVLDMLRNELGNENYRKSIIYYLKKHYHKNVETCDLISSIYEATGRNVQWFFDQWIYRGGEPRIEVSYQIKDNVLTYNINQVHKREPTVTAFRLPMTVSIYYKNGDVQQEKVTLQNDKDTFKISLKSGEIKMALLDENVDFLRKIKYLDTTINSAIALNSKSTLARSEAVIRMKKMAWNDKKEILAQVYHAEKSQIVKREILEHINETTKDEIATDILHHALSDSHHLVRRQAINSTFIKSSLLKNDLIARMDDSSYVNIEAAVSKLVELHHDENLLFINHIKNTNGIAQNLNYLYSSLVINDTVIIQKDDAIKRMKYLASENLDYRVRVNATNFLHQKKIFDKDVIYSLIQGTLHFHPGVRNTSASYLNDIKKSNPEMYNEVLKSYPFREPNQTLKKVEQRISVFK